MNILQRLITRRKAAKLAAGWDYAAGSLLRGVSIQELLSYVEIARDFGDYDSFDAGIKAAVEAWSELHHER